MKNWNVNILTVKLLSVAANELVFSEHTDTHKAYANVLMYWCKICMQMYWEMNFYLLMKSFSYHLNELLNEHENSIFLYSYIASISLYIVTCATLFSPNSHSLMDTHLFTYRWSLKKDRTYFTAITLLAGNFVREGICVHRFVCSHIAAAFHDTPALANLN